MFFMMTIMFVAFFGSQMVRAESYQRWITFDQPGHIMTANELADITGALGRGEISPQATYKLSTGITYKISQPDLFLQYIVMCVKEGEPSIVTIEDIVREIQGGDVVQWGNDINVKVKNYYFSSLHNKIQYIDNYSGNDGVFVLLIHGNPKIKMDCGNPLWVIGGERIPLQVEPKPRNELEQKVKISSFNFPEDLGGSVTKQVQKAWSYEPPITVKKKFFRRTGVVIGCVVLGAGGVGGILYAIFHKGADTPHGTMSNGRGDDGTTNGTGTQDGGRGD